MNENKFWYIYIYAMQFYLAMKKKKIMLFQAVTRTADHLQNKINQISLSLSFQNLHTQYTHSHIWNI